MEFRSEPFIIFGILGLLAWLVGNFNLFKRAEIYFSYEKGFRLRLTKMLHLMIGITAWGFLSFALMGPRVPAGSIKGKTEVNDIFLVVDVSTSMLATDFLPNRLEVAKKKILDFVKLRPTDRIGIIIFGTSVFTLLPLSTDMKLIEQMVKEINTKFLGGGTNIGDALGLATARASQSLAKNKVIILLTDGVSNVGNLTPIQAAEEAGKQQLKVYTIGIGTKENKKILKLYPGSRRGYQKIPGGSVDLETLEEISKITRGKSFFAKDATALKQVFDDIQKLEKTEIESSARVLYKEKYWFYLVIGVGLLVIAEVMRRFVLREGW